MHKFYGIGVGPGDRELLTIRGYDLLRKAVRVFTPTGKDGKPGIAYRIVQTYIPENTPVEGLNFPMVDLKENREDLLEIWEENARIIEKSLGEGDTVFLTLGDPSIFSTYSYLVDFLSAKGIKTETVPGISAFSALAARLNHPLIQGEESLAVLSMTKDLESLEKAIDLHDSIVVMKVSADPKFLYEILKKKRLERNFILASDLQTEKERISTNIEDLKQNVPYMSTVLIHKGRTFHEG